MRLIVLLPLLLLSAASGPERVVSGYYTVDWEVQSFRPCGGGGPWWVSDPGPLMQAYRELVEEEYGTIFVTVRVDLTDEGRFGHLGAYRRAMAVRELFEARAPSPERDDCSRIREAD